MSEGFINNIVSFLEKNTNYNVSDVTGAMDSIADDIYHCGQSENSIFTLEEGTEMSYDDFLELMSDAAQMDVSKLNADEMEMLFNILNSGSDDDVLTYDELKIFAKGDEITDFSMWCAIACITEDEVNDASKTEEEGGDSSVTSGSSSSAPSSGSTTTWSGPKYTDDGKHDFSDIATAQYYIDQEKTDEDKTPKDVADRLLKEGVISEEEYEKIKSAYSKLTDAQIEKAQARANQKGISFEEAVKELGFVENSDFDKPFPLSDEEIKNKANALYDAMRGAGTKDNIIKSILEDENISPDDFVRIMTEYLPQDTDGDGVADIGKGSLVHHLASDLSAHSSDITEKEAMELVGKKLLEAANNGNEEAINIICIELMNGTAGMNGTAEHFVEYIINNASEEVLSKIYSVYPEVNKGHTLIDDIKGDYSWATGESDLINNIYKKVGITD